MEIKSSLSAFLTLEDWYEEVRSNVKLKGGVGAMFSLVSYNRMEFFKVKYISGILPEKLADDILNNKI